MTAMTAGLLYATSTTSATSFTAVQPNAFDRVPQNDNLSLGPILDVFHGTGTTQTDEGWMAIAQLDAGQHFKLAIGTLGHGKDWLFHALFA